jgi:MFS family permease
MLRTILPARRDARLILLGTLCSAVGRGLTLPFLFIYLTRVRNVDATSVFLLVSWMGVVSLALAPFAGSLIDRLGARFVVAPLLLVASSGSVLLAFARNIWSAGLAVTVIAVGFSGVWSGWNTILASLVEPEHRQRTFGLSFTLLNLGIGTGGLIAGLLADVSRVGTFQALYFGDAVSFLLPFGILLILRHVGRRVASDSTAAGDPAAPTQGGYRQVLRDGAFVRFFLFGLVLTTVGYAQIEVGFTAFATNVVEASPRVISWSFSANTLVIVVLQLFVVRWLEGRSRTRALSVVALIFGASWVVLALAGIARGTGWTVAAGIGVVACSMIFAVGETMMSPVMPAITNALATDELRGRYNAMAGMVFGLSGIIGPVAAGPLIGRGHDTAWLVLVIAGCVVAAGLALRLHGRLTPAQDGRGISRSSQPTPATSGAVAEATLASP